MENHSDKTASNGDGGWESPDASYTTTLRLIEHKRTQKDMLF